MSLEENLIALGIDPVRFKNYAEGCPSVFSFPSVAAGVTCDVRCQMRGEHTRHKAIFHGFPYEWTDDER
jgi:hypothetical protein